MTINRDWINHPDQAELKSRYLVCMLSGQYKNEKRFKKIFFNYFYANYLKPLDEEVSVTIGEKIVMELRDYLYSTEPPRFQPKFFRMDGYLCVRLVNAKEILDYGIQKMRQKNSLWNRIMFATQFHYCPKYVEIDIKACIGNVVKLFKVPRCFDIEMVKG